MAKSAFQPLDESRCSAWPACAPAGPQSLQRSDVHVLSQERTNAPRGPTGRHLDQAMVEAAQMRLGARPFPILRTRAKSRPDSVPLDIARATRAMGRHRLGHSPRQLRIVSLFLPVANRPHQAANLSKTNTTSWRMRPSSVSVEPPSFGGGR